MVRPSLSVRAMRALGLILLCAMASHAMADDVSEERNVLLGAGVERMPAWIGSSEHRDQAVPYIQAELPWHVTLSTLDGLTVDVIHGSQWHGGFYGNYQWGRDHDELGPQLSGIVPSLSPRLNAGGYLEYQATVQLNLGATLSHDTQGAGAYLNIYADYDLPVIGYLEHSVQLQWQGMNGPAMRRYFGLTPQQATQLGVAPWAPGAGSQQISLEYDAYMPTSLHTGFALAINYARLLGDAADSPLVKTFGTPNQLTTTLAFVYRL